MSTLTLLEDSFSDSLVALDLEGPLRARLEVVVVGNGHKAAAFPMPRSGYSGNGSLPEGPVSYKLEWNVPGVTPLRACVLFLSPRVVFLPQNNSNALKRLSCGKRCF